VSGLAIALVSFCSYKLHFNAATVVLLYLLVIVWQSLAGRFALSAAVALVAALCLDFFFLPPLLSLRIADPLNLLAFIVFVVIALVVTRLVSRLGAEAERARRRSRNLEQLYQVAQQLLLVKPEQLDAAPLVKVIREGFSASAVCLFDAGTAELRIEGSSRRGLAERTRHAYILGADSADLTAGVVVRCLRAGSAVTGAIGFEDLPDSEWIAGPLSVLAASSLEQARAFRTSSYEIAAAQTEVFRTAVLDALGHEFKTPLATMMAVVGGLQESQRLGPEEQEMAGIIEQETSRLSGLTNRLLRMARLDREEVKPRMRNTDIPALVQRVVERYAAQAQEHQVTVSGPCSCGHAPADAELLDLALTQLLDNAFKYSLPGSPVAITIEPEDSCIAVRIRNQGSSIPPHERDRIFERFYRGIDVRKLVSGAGLGLHVARKIAVAHGGNLVLDQSTSPGSVIFCLTLPKLKDESRHVPSNN